MPTSTLTPRPSPVRSLLTESRRTQALAVLGAVALMAAWHWNNDGLWLQGDAPRHAVTGLLFRDLLVDHPADPLGYALGYFARYPAIVPGAYPPLFHVLEGVGFAVAGPSPLVPKVLVFGSTAVLAWYTLLWGRRWIAPLAGWAGACVVLTPVVVELSSGVLLNMPAAACGVAALYHAHAWLETPTPTERRWFVGFGLAAMATYLPGAIVVPIVTVWVSMRRGIRGLRPLVLPVAAFGAAVVVTALLLPTHVARQGPTFARLFDGVGWQFYAAVIARGLGATWLALAALGLVLGGSSPAHRRQTARLALAVLTTIVCLVALPARDLRYTAIAAPLVVLLGFVAVVRVLDFVPGGGRALAPLTTVALLALSTRAALATPVMRVDGIDEVARFLAQAGPQDGVLYSGVYDGIFTFYVRAADPSFERRVVLTNRLLAEQQQGADFVWRETMRVSTPSAVAPMLRDVCGCRWVAIERGGDWITAADRLLMDAAQGPDLTLVRSFPVRAGRVTRVDVYRVSGEIVHAPPMDLAFPSFTARVFRGVEPVSRRR